MSKVGNKFSLMIMIQSTIVNKQNRVTRDWLERVNQSEISFTKTGTDLFNNEDIYFNYDGTYENFKYFLSGNFALIDSWCVVGSMFPAEDGIHYYKDGYDDENHNRLGFDFATKRVFLVPVII